MLVLEGNVALVLFRIYSLRETVCHTMADSLSVRGLRGVQSKQMLNAIGGGKKRQDSRARVSKTATSLIARVVPDTLDELREF